MDPKYHGKDGKFKKGNKGGPGNPYAKQVNKFRNKLINCFTDKDIEKLAQNMKRIACKGRGTEAIGAAKLVLSYICGKPLDRVEITGLEGGPVQFTTGDDALLILQKAVRQKIKDKEESEN